LGDSLQIGKNNKKILRFHKLLNYVLVINAVCIRFFTKYQRSVNIKYLQQRQPN